MTKLVVCRVGDQPAVEDIKDVYQFVRYDLLGGDYLEEKRIFIDDQMFVFYWAENDPNKELPLNRHIPAVSPSLRGASFIVDTRKGPPEAYAKPGELGYFAIKGNFVVTRIDDRGDCKDLKPEEIEMLTNLFELKCEYCHSQPKAYKGARFCGAGCTAAYEMKIPFNPNTI